MSREKSSFVLEGPPMGRYRRYHPLHVGPPVLDNVVTYWWRGAKIYNIAQ